MEGAVLSFFKTEWKVSDTGSVHWASSLFNMEGFEVDIVKHGIFFPTDPAVELLCVVSIFCKRCNVYSYALCISALTKRPLKLLDFLKATHSVSGNILYWRMVLVTLSKHGWSRTNGTRVFTFFELYTWSDFLETKSPSQKPPLMFKLLYPLFVRWYHSSLSLFLVFRLCWVNVFHSDSLAVGDGFAAVSGMTALWWEILMFVNWFTKYIWWHFSI